MKSYVWPNLKLILTDPSIYLIIFITIFGHFANLGFALFGETVGALTMCFIWAFDEWKDDQNNLKPKL